jgi:hypothetical protein
MEKEKTGQMLKATGLALGILGSAIAIHHRSSFGRWCDDKDPCHGRAGLALTGVGIPLLIAGNELNKKGKK